MTLRKAGVNEIDALAKHFAKCFDGYPLYEKYYYPKETYYLDKNFYIFKFDLLRSLDCIYTNDEHTVAAVYFPAGKRKKTKYVFRYAPLLFFEIIFKVKPVAAIRALKYVGVSSKKAKKHMRDNDGYLSQIAISEALRGQGNLGKALDAISGGDSIYLETHTLQNAEMYLHKGFSLLEEEVFPYCDKFNAYYMRRS